MVFDLQFSPLFARDKVLEVCFVFYLQEYARKALDFLWEKRQRSSNLVGVTINIHTGDWVRKGMKVGFKIRPSHPQDGRKYSIFLCEGDRDSILSHFSRIAFAGAGRCKTLISSRIKGSEDFVSRHSPALSLCVCVCVLSLESGTQTPKSCSWNLSSVILGKLCHLCLPLYCVCKMRHQQHFRVTVKGP